MLDLRNSYSRPQPPPNHSTVWTGALLDKALQSMERPPPSLPSLETPAVSAVAVAAAPVQLDPAAAPPDELVPVSHRN